MIIYCCLVSYSNQNQAETLPYIISLLRKKVNTNKAQLLLLGQYPEKFKKDGRPLGLYFFGFRDRPRSDSVLYYLLVLTK